MIDRRHWLAAAAGLAGTAWHASSQALPPHIFWITNLPIATLPIRAVFTEAMRERAWIDGTNYVLEELHYESLASLVAELVQRRVDMIVVSGSVAMGPAMKAASTIPIVFLNVGDPVGSDFVSYFARPGGNVADRGGLSEGLIVKQLDLLTQAVPRAPRIGMLHHPEFPSHAAVMSALEPAAKRQGLLLRPVAMRPAQDIDPAFAALAADRVDAALLFGQPSLASQAVRLGALGLTLPQSPLLQATEVVE